MRLHYDEFIKSFFPIYFVINLFDCEKLKIFGLETRQSQMEQKIVSLTWLIQAFFQRFFKYDNRFRRFANSPNQTRKIAIWAKRNAVKIRRNRPGFSFQRF